MKPSELNSEVPANKVYSVVVVDDNCDVSFSTGKKEAQSTAVWN